MGPVWEPIKIGPSVLLPCRMCKSIAAASDGAYLRNRLDKTLCRLCPDCGHVEPNEAEITRQSLAAGP